MRAGTVLVVASAAAVLAVVMAHWRRVHYWRMSRSVVARSELSWPAELSVRLVVAGLIVVAFACVALLVAESWPDGGLPERGQVIRPRRWQQAA